MLRELDVVEGEWAALSWALGSTTALFRHSVPLLLRGWLEKCFGPTRELILKNIAKKTVALLSGVVIAGGILTFCVRGLLLVPLLFPEWQLGHAPLAECFVVVVVPEITYLFAAVVLWRRRRSIAAGILLAGFTLVTHVILHLAMHGWAG